MKRYNTNKYNIQGKCQVCGEPVMVAETARNA